MLKLTTSEAGQNLPVGFLFCFLFFDFFGFCCFLIFLVFVVFKFLFIFDFILAQFDIHDLYLLQRLVTVKCSSILSSLQHGGDT